MAQGFARLYRRFWADERVRQLSPEQKLVAVYLLTGQSNRIGLFRFSLGMAEDDLGLPRKRLDTVCHTVCHTLSWGWDPRSSVVWIRSWWRWNPPDNSDALAGYMKDLADVPKTMLLHDFKTVLDTLYPTVWDTVCPTVVMPFPIPSPSLSGSIPEPNPEPEPVCHTAPPQRPTPTEVAAYMRSIGRPDDSQRFCDHYQSNGWKVGRNPMRDWQASVRNWNGSGPPRLSRGRMIVQAGLRMKAQEESHGSS